MICRLIDQEMEFNFFVEQYDKYLHLNKIIIKFIDRMFIKYIIMINVSGLKDIIKTWQEMVAEVSSKEYDYLDYRDEQFDDDLEVQQVDNYP